MPPRLIKFPEGTKFGEWHISQEDWGTGIRRHYTTPDGKRHKQRYPLSKYKHLLGNEAELARLVVRLNGDDPFKRRAREVTELRHAYVSPEFLEKYYNEVLRTSIAAEKDSRTAYRYLVEYGLHFFMIKLGVQSPIDWEQHQFTWARSLLNRPDDDLPEELRLFQKDDIKSAKVLRYIVWELNRFLAYLHAQRRTEIPLIILQPLTKKTLDTHEARRRLAGKVDKSKYITDEHWKIIDAALDTRMPESASLFRICRYYGLRRNEGLGLTTQAMRNDHIVVSQQLVGYEREKLPKLPRRKRGEPKPERPEPEVKLIYGPVKDRDFRKVPHSLCGQTDLDTVYSWIEDIEKIRSHFDTISTKFADLTEELCGERYNIDDLRPTFLTEAMSEAVKADPEHGPEKVRLAAGHASIKTTFGHYIKDTRKLSDQEYIPKKKR